MSMARQNEIVLRTDRLSKRYLLPSADTGAELAGSRLAQATKRLFPSLKSDDEKSWFWALHETSLEVKRGEILGIIGRNGAGKSTLLKLLASITLPSGGRAELLGRVGSLLEVGTGFHPDLTGRQNIVLAAALLGIGIADAKAQMEEIIDIAGLQDFADVAVKRYSSGMYMRLAFAVTSMLECDILLLDEVLAVGDTDFQSKAKSSMRRSAREGQTVLFVSHSMQSIRNTCTKCIWIDRGKVVEIGKPDDVVDSYIAATTPPLDEEADLELVHGPSFVSLEHHAGYNTHTRSHPMILGIETLSLQNAPTRLFNSGDGVRVRVSYDAQPVSQPYISIALHTMDDDRITIIHSPNTPTSSIPPKGIIECHISALKIMPGDYSIVIELGSTENGAITPIDSVMDATRIRVNLGNYLGEHGMVRNQGYLVQPSEWSQIELAPAQSEIPNT